MDIVKDFFLESIFKNTQIHRTSPSIFFCRLKENVGGLSSLNSQGKVIDPEDTFCLMVL